MESTLPKEILISERSPSIERIFIKVPTDFLVVNSDEMQSLFTFLNIV